MTNLIASRRRQWITRGRVLVGLPMAFGLLLCMPLLVVLLRPTWQNVQELGRRRDSLLQLQRNLPVVEAKLEAETAAAASQEEIKQIRLGFEQREAAIEHEIDHKPLDVHLSLDIEYNFLSK